MNFIGGKLKLKNLKNEKSSNLIGKIGIKDIKPENKIEKKDEKKPFLWVSPCRFIK